MVRGLAVKNILEIWRDKKILITSIFFPVLLLGISQFILRHADFLTENIPLAVVNPEPRFPQAGRLLVLSLERAESYRQGHPLYALLETGRQNAFQQLQSGRVAGMLLVPRGFSRKLSAGRPEKLVLIVNGADPRAGVLEGSLAGFADHFGMLVRKSRETFGQNPVTLRTVEKGRENLPPRDESLAGAALFAFLFLIPYAAGQLVSEIEKGSLDRFRLARVSPARIFGGVFAATLFLAWLQAAVLLGTAFALNLRPYFLVLWIWPLAGLFVLASAGTGLILASLVEKEKQLNLFSSLILIPLFIFSGPLGKELADFPGRRWIPWNQGYSELIRVLDYQVPRANALAGLALSSLILAVLGFFLFSIRRLRCA